LLTLLALTNCTPSTKVIEIQSKPIEKIRLEIPSPRPANLNEVQWRVITNETAEGLLEENIVLFGISVEDYKNLATNNGELLRVLEGLSNVLIAYRNYYEPKVLTEEK